jgi:hypothetical protein
MRGPYLLRPLQVDISVPTKIGGVYCLSKSPKSVNFIGRADSNLRDAIKAHWPEYQMFWYDPALSAREAYVNHCRVYHKHADNGLEDKAHPAAPARLDLKCPVCGK